MNYNYTQYDMSDVTYVDRIYLCLNTYILLEIKPECSVKRVSEEIT